MVVTLFEKNLPNGTAKYMLKPGHDMPSFVSKTYFLYQLILDMDKTYVFETKLDIS